LNLAGRFERIFATNLWGATSPSGLGSELHSTAGLREQLPGFLRRLGIRTLLDVPCGAGRLLPELRAFAPLGPLGVPQFDLVWLGMGADGHTASLCPNDPSLAVTDRWVVPTWPAGYETARLTLTYPVLDGAREVTFLVTGQEKAATLSAIVGGADLPAGHVRAESVTWLVDAAAAGLLRGEQP